MGFQIRQNFTLNDEYPIISLYMERILGLIPNRKERKQIRYERKIIQVINPYTGNQTTLWYWKNRTRDTRLLERNQTGGKAFDTITDFPNTMSTATVSGEIHIKKYLKYWREERKKKDKQEKQTRWENDPECQARRRFIRLGLMGLAAATGGSATVYLALRHGPEIIDSIDKWQEEESKRLADNRATQTADNLNATQTQVASNAQATRQEQTNATATQQAREQQIQAEIERVEAIKHAIVRSTAKIWAINEHGNRTQKSYITVATLPLPDGANETVLLTQNIALDPDNPENYGGGTLTAIHISQLPYPGNDGNSLDLNLADDVSFGKFGDGQVIGVLSQGAQSRIGRIFTPVSVDTELLNNVYAGPVYYMSHDESLISADPVHKWDIDPSVTITWFDRHTRFPFVPEYNERFDEAGGDPIFGIRPDGSWGPGSPCGGRSPRRCRRRAEPCSTAR